MAKSKGGKTSGMMQSAKSTGGMMNKKSPKKGK